MRRVKTATQCVRCEANRDPFGAISPPIYQTATFRQLTASEFGEYDYTRTANPTRFLVERQLAVLEGGKHGCAFSSGMAAITALTRLLRNGDHIVAGNDLYGGTVRLLDQVLSRAGICVSYVDTTDLEEVRASLNERTRLALIETPTNPLLRICDIKALAQLVHSAGTILAVDNSMLSPCFQQPLALGADVVIHSATKFLCGHSDVTAGALITNDAQLYRQLAFQQNAEGAGLSPFESWLLLRGMKTLVLRVAQQSTSAGAIADFLSRQPAVKSVYYPGLVNHQGHQLHRAQASGDGAVITFTTGDTLISERFVSATQLFDIAVSFGSVRSTISLPAAMSHASIPQSLKEKMAPPPDLVRLSIGIEDVDDLIGDLTQAFCVITDQHSNMRKPIGVSDSIQGR
jgi:Cystathionine beta-lyases/cystathionine gamma-synthases